MKCFSRDTESFPFREAENLIQKLTPNNEAGDTHKNNSYKNGVLQNRGDNDLMLFKDLLITSQDWKVQELSHFSGYLRRRLENSQKPIKIYRIRRPGCFMPLFFQKKILVLIFILKNL